MIYFTIVFAFLISIACFWASTKMIKIYLKVNKWKRVEAKVISKKVEINKKRSNSGTAIYIPVVEYSYEFSGKNYSGNHVYLEELVGGNRNARKHQVEQKLNAMDELSLVFVNPQNPSQSVLYCDGVGIYFVVLFIGVTSLLYVIGSLISIL